LPLTQRAEAIRIAVENLDHPHQRIKPSFSSRVMIIWAAS